MMGTDDELDLEQALVSITRLQYRKSRSAAATDLTDAWRPLAHHQMAGELFGLLSCLCHCPLCCCDGLRSLDEWFQATGSGHWRRQLVKWCRHS